MAGWTWTEAELDAELTRAEAAGQRAAQDEPRAVAARYDRTAGRLVVDLTNGASFMVPAALLEGLGDAAPEVLEAIELAPGGEGLRWEALDVDLSVPGLLAGFFGSSTWMRDLGRRGGAARTPRKAQAARENGRKGGRPRRAGP